MQTFINERVYKIEKKRLKRKKNWLLPFFILDLSISTGHLNFSLTVLTLFNFWFIRPTHSQLLLVISNVSFIKSRLKRIAALFFPTTPFSFLLLSFLLLIYSHIQRRKLDVGKWWKGQSYEGASYYYYHRSIARTQPAQRMFHLIL